MTAHGADRRCDGCGAVHYDLPADVWTCSFCGLEHVELTREEGRMFIQAFAGPSEDEGEE